MLDVLGLDIGNVIIGNDADQMFWRQEQRQDLSQIAAIRAIKSLNEDIFQGRIHLISRASPLACQQTLIAFAQSDFYEKTGIDRRRLHFTLERDRKLIHCRRVGVTIFVDDNPEVLVNLIGTVPHLIAFRPKERETQKYAEFMPQIQIAQTWDDVVRYIHLIFLHP